MSLRCSLLSFKRMFPKTGARTTESTYFDKEVNIYKAKEQNRINIWIIRPNKAF